MGNKSRVLFIQLLCHAMIFILGGHVHAQRVKSVHGTGEYYLYENDRTPVPEAKQMCIKIAQVNAIKAEFGGEIISSNIAMLDANVNGEAMSQFMESINSYNKAVWVEDTKKPIVTMDVQDGCIIFRAEVWGKARECSNKVVDFDWEILAGGTDDKCKNSKFNHGQCLHIKFRTPVDGYLAVYLLEKTHNIAHCLLPYKDNPAGMHFVKGAMDYCLFNPNDRPKPPHYKMTTNSPIEMDELVVIFSPNRFVKCNEVSNDRLHPNSLKMEDFEKWLSKLRINDDEMAVERSVITIINEKAINK